VADFLHKKQKFYLFKISFTSDDETRSYLGVTGPYPLSGNTIITSSDASGLNWDDEYDKSRISELFEKYLADAESYSKQKDQPAGK